MHVHTHIRVVYRRPCRRRLRRRPTPAASGHAHMKPRRYSYGLGGFSGVSNTLALGSNKRITHNKFHILIFWFLLAVCRTNKERLCMSIILALQRNNEIYKHIHINNHCYTYVPSTNLAFTKTCVAILTISVLTLWVISLLLLCGDVHLNPGPGSVGGSTDSSIDSSASQFQILENHLSILHLNKVSFQNET